MKANRPKNTGPEMRLRRALWAAGLKGYRVGWSKAPGRPDIAYTAKKVAIFVHGCYWHRCPSCARALPKANAEFWQRKFTRNVERDARKRDELAAAGWDVLTIWECQLRADLEGCVTTIQERLDAARRPANSGL